MCVLGGFVGLLSLLEREVCGVVDEVCWLFVKFFIKC